MKIHENFEYRYNFVQPLKEERKERKKEKMKKKMLRHK